MATIRANGLDFEVECFGSVQNPAVLLIMGLGMQLTAWPAEFIQTLVDANCRVIVFDNRDCGLSSRFESAGRPNLMMLGLRNFLHFAVPSPYHLEDMADDCIAILDALQIGAAHVVGVSMGGMIAQLLAADHPGRVLTLSSIMSSSGAPYLPQARPEVLHALMGRPRDVTNFESIVEYFLDLYRVIGSPGFPTPPELARTRVVESVRRSYYPSGTARQMAAVLASGDRSPQLARIQAPTLVIHGMDDVLVPVEAGRDSARKIKGSRLLLVPGMGHDLAPGLVPILCGALTDHFTPSSR